MKIAIIGGGVSGLSVANILKGQHQITVYEREGAPGGLIQCQRVNGSLFHTCGGHVFNSKRKDVLDWFWSKFERNEEFVHADRNAVVVMDNGLQIPYPIENHVYLFENEIQKSFIEDLLKMSNSSTLQVNNFEDFLKQKFGCTLYELYFRPYNEKVWQRSLKDVPISWLEGKLPMPSVSEMIYNNMNHIKEKQFVHSTFWYEKKGGSQFLADRLAEDLDIRYGKNILCFARNGQEWLIDGELYEKVVFCGNIKEMIHHIEGVDVSDFINTIDSLEYHGTTSVFCEIDKNPYSWIYQPSDRHQSHRIICTGNFSETNNNVNIGKNRITATVEFTDEVSFEGILDNLKHIPFNPKYLTHKYNKYTYPIQSQDTRTVIKKLKEKLSKSNFYFTGRFADWEYYNMDVAIGAAMDLCNKSLL